MNQTDIPDYRYYLGCNAKRMVRLTFLEKNFVSQSEVSTYSLILFSKNSEFLSGQSCSKLIFDDAYKVSQINVPD